MMHNDSDERGAKLITGSRYWKNYSVEADISLLGADGDAGLIIRSENEEEGVNAYSGYYAGVRILDNSIVLGRADHGWAEIAKANPAPHRIRPDTWYHLKLLAFECQIAAVVTIPGQTAPVSVGFTDPACIRSGRVGLRSYSSGGVWRNITVRPVTHRDLIAVAQRPSAISESTQNRLSAPDRSLTDAHQFLEEELGEMHSGSLVSRIASLQLESQATPVTATVRGEVILTAPRVYIQDLTGGLYLPEPAGPPLKVGDEIEATGQVYPGDFSSTMKGASTRVLWAQTPMPPVSVTASQAATGKYDATFVEVRGRLLHRHHGPGNTLILDMDEGPQAFRAIMNPGRSKLLFDELKPNSILRLRGICVVDSLLTQNLTPFVLLLRSNEDLNVVAGPPWWTTGHIVTLVIAVFGLTLLAVFAYHRAEQWRLRTILEERGRLAHDIHDTLAQSFAGIGFQLQAIRNGLPDDMPVLQQQFELASELVRHSHEEARRSITTLHSEALESQNLLVTLEQCARQIVLDNSIRIVAEQAGDPRQLPLRITDALYRIGQESIANAVRHSKLTCLSMRITYAQNSVRLELEDDGGGFIMDARHLGFGIRGMRRRAQTISATFLIQSQPGRGTRVQVDAPLERRTRLAVWMRLLRS